jgi:branched-chain amino acid transport system substrate-binding protein
MSQPKISRRDALRMGGAASAGLVTFMGPWKHVHVYAAATDKPIKIGLTHDASGQFGASGQSEKLGTILAIDEANEKGGLLGRKLTHVWQDTETTPATGTRVAERFITREEVAFVVGAVQSGVANAISQVCQKYGVIYFNTNSSSTTESGKDCHRTKFMWDGNSHNFALASVKAGIDQFGKNWLLLTNDYVWGRDQSGATRRTLERYGGKVVDEIMVPVGTRDFSAILLKAQQIKADVVAPAIGGDDFKSMRQQIIDQGLDRKLRFSGGAVPDWPDAWPLGPSGVFGIFPTNWYHYLELPGVADFTAKYKRKFPNAPEPVPGNVFYNGYYAMRELIRTVERVGSTNNLKIIKALEGHRMPARDRMQHHDAWIDPNSHHNQQTIYVGARNFEPRDKTDLFKIIGMAKPEDVMSETEKDCKLETYEATPTYEM